MSKDTSRAGGSATEMGLTLEQLIRRGARDLIQNAIEVEVRELLVEHGNVRKLSGAAAVVRNGYLPVREVLTAVGPVEGRIPKVHGKRSTRPPRLTTLSCVRPRAAAEGVTGAPRPQAQIRRAHRAALLDTLPVQHTELTLYGKAQWVRVRSTLAVARFLKGISVRAVWCEMRQPDHTWSRPRLILATETDLSAQVVVQLYAERWGIEPLFHNLKRWCGVWRICGTSRRQRWSCGCRFAPPLMP